MISKTTKWFLSVYTLFLIVGAIVLFHLEKGDWVINLNQNRIHFADLFFKYWTHFGDGLFILLLILIFLFVKYRYAIILITISAVQGILSFVLKRIVFTGSMRPKKYLEGIYELQLIDGVNVHSYHSFPSGHTMTAFSIAVFLCLISSRKVFGPLLFLYALLVGVSRNYLSQHFFVDIYVGSILGVTVSILVWILFRNKEKTDWLGGSLRDKF